MRHKEQRARLSSHTIPVYSAHKLKVGRSEVKRPSIQYYGLAAVVNLPQPASIDAPLPRCQHIPVQIYRPELQHPVLVYDEFLVHFAYLFYFNLVPQ